MKQVNLRFMTVVVMLFIVAVGLSAQDDLAEPWEKRYNERQPPAYVMKEIGVRPGMTIGEIGAGRGRYTVYLAKEVGQTGKIYANDIDESSLAYLRGRCRRLNITNVETIVGEMDNPLFPNNSLDMAIMVLVYHMIEKPDSLLINLKSSLKPGSSLVIVDPRDEEIDSEFGIDRSKSDAEMPTIKERVQNSAKAAGYMLVKVDTTLAHDYIFILNPLLIIQRKSAGVLIHEAMLQQGIEASVELFNMIKGDTAHYDLSEKVFSIMGSEFLGAKSYPEALAVLNMGVELFPESSILYGVIGEVYLVTDEREKARTYYRLFLEHGPDSVNTDIMMQNFDVMYDQLHQQN